MLRAGVYALSRTPHAEELGHSVRGAAHQAWAGAGAAVLSVLRAVQRRTPVAAAAPGAAAGRGVGGPGRALLTAAVEVHGIRVRMRNPSPPPLPLSAGTGAAAAATTTTTARCSKGEGGGSRQAGEVVVGEAERAVLRVWVGAERLEASAGLSRVRVSHVRHRLAATGEAPAMLCLEPPARAAADAATASPAAAAGGGQGAAGYAVELTARAVRLRRPAPGHPEPGASEGRHSGLGTPGSGGGDGPGQAEGVGAESGGWGRRVAVTGAGPEDMEEALLGGGAGAGLEASLAVGVAAVGVSAAALDDVRAFAAAAVSGSVAGGSRALGARLRGSAAAGRAAGIRYSPLAPAAARFPDGGGGGGARLPWRVEVAVSSAAAALFVPAGAGSGIRKDEAEEKGGRDMTHTGWGDVVETAAVVRAEDVRWRRHGGGGRAGGGGTWGRVGRVAVYDSDAEAVQLHPPPLECPARDPGAIDAAASEHTGAGNATAGCGDSGDGSELRGADEADGDASREGGGGAALEVCYSHCARRPRRATGAAVAAERELVVRVGAVRSHVAMGFVTTLWLHVTRSEAAADHLCRLAAVAAAAWQRARARAAELLRRAGGGGDDDEEGAAWRVDVTTGGGTLMLPCGYSGGGRAARDAGGGGAEGGGCSRPLAARVKERAPKGVSAGPVANRHSLPELRV